MPDHGVTWLPGQLNDADGKSINISRLIHQPADASNGVLACLGQFHEPWMSTEEPFLDFPAVPGKQALLLRAVEVALSTDDSRRLCAFHRREAEPLVQK